MPTSTWFLPGPTSIDVPAVTVIRVQLMGGGVELVGWDGDGARLEVLDVAGEPLEATREGDRLTLGYSSLGWDGWIKRLTSHRGKDSAQVRVLVGPNTRVRVAASSAITVVRSVREDVTVASASGLVRVDSCHGAVSARTVSGGVEVAGHDGPVAVTTISGRVDVSGLVAKIDVSSVTGDVAIRGSLASSRVRVSTVSGGLEVAMPADSGLVLTARTVSGAVLVDGESRRTSGGPGTVSVLERTADAAYFVDVNTVNGPVAITRGDSDGSPSAADAEAQAVREVAKDALDELPEPPQGPGVDSAQQS